MANIAYHVIFKHWNIGTLFSKQIVWCEHTCLLCSPTCQYPGSISSGFPGPPLKIITPHKVVKNMNSVIITGKSSEGTGLELRLILDSVTEACFLIHNVEQWQFSARAAVTTGTGHSVKFLVVARTVHQLFCVSPVFSSANKCPNSKTFGDWCSHFLAVQFLTESGWLIHSVSKSGSCELG